MITANFNTTLIGQMFNKDFKQHLKAIESLNKFVAQDLDAVTGNLDLLLKWITLRFFETNPSVLLRGLEFLREVFTNLADREYNLHDIEAVSFIPYLLNKSGDPKDQVILKWSLLKLLKRCSFDFFSFCQVRNSVKTIVKLLCNVYPATKMSTYLMTGLQSKNAKQRTECLDELGHILQNHGSSVLQPSAGACLKEIAKQIADRDNSVRNAALNCITEIYFQVNCS